MQVSVGRRVVGNRQRVENGEVEAGTAVGLHRRRLCGLRRERRTDSGAGLDLTHELDPLPAVPAPDRPVALAAALRAVWLVVLLGAFLGARVALPAVWLGAFPVAFLGAGVALRVGAPGRDALAAFFAVAFFAGLPLVAPAPAGADRTAASSDSRSSTLRDRAVSSAVVTTPIMERARSTSKRTTLTKAVRLLNDVLSRSSAIALTCSAVASP